MRRSPEPHRNQGIPLHREAIGRRLHRRHRQGRSTRGRGRGQRQRRTPAVAFTENRRATGRAVATDPAAPLDGRGHERPGPPTGPRRKCRVTRRSRRRPRLAHERRHCPRPGGFEVVVDDEGAPPPGLAQRTVAPLPARLAATPESARSIDVTWLVPPGPRRHPLVAGRRFRHDEQGEQQHDQGREATRVPPPCFPRRAPLPGTSQCSTLRLYVKPSRRPTLAPPSSR